jgi:hypothetical protein
MLNQIIKVKISYTLLIFEIIVAYLSHKERNIPLKGERKI